MMEQTLDKLPARTGWLWLREGMTMYRRQPGALTTLLFLSILCSLALTSLPYVGPVLAVLLMPSFSMAVLGGCALIERNERVMLPVFLNGFRKPVLPRLMKLGLIYLALVLLLAVATRMMVDPSFMEQLSRQDPKNVPTMDPGTALAMLALMAFQVASFSALAFAAPLMAWNGMALGKAVFYSVMAVARAWRVFVVLFASWFGFMMVSSFLAGKLFGLVNLTFAQAAQLWVMLLFVLFMQCAIYAGYRQLFGAPSPSAEAGGP
jgi:hypothetical protein